MKIAFFETRQDEKDYFKEFLKEHELRFFSGKLDNSNVEEVKDFEIVSIFTGSEIKRELLKKFSNLRMIVTRSTGYDHIDLQACKEMNITVCNIPAYGTDSVAEYTFVLILALTKRLLEGIERTKKGIFSFEGLTGIELKGKTLGIIGAGKIGRRVAEIAKTFGMKVIAYDIFQIKEEAERIGYVYVDLETLLENSDIISIHANLTKENYHLLGEREFSLMKDGVIIVNTARGALIESLALIKALKEGKVAYAGLDVLEEEGLIKEEMELLYRKEEDVEKLKKALANNLLIQMENETSRVIITPHNAFNTKEALENIKETTLKTILSFIKGKPINVVK